MSKQAALTQRKTPKQRRSQQMRNDILTAGIRVLRKEGALRFTTWRVAEAAGISVGSFYQYFPNKHALVFAIHTKTVELAWRDVQNILEHNHWTPRQKLRRIARLFFSAENNEVAEMGAALKNTEVFFDAQPEYRAINALVLERFTRFLEESLPPRTARREIEFATRLLMTTIESVGKAVANLRLSERDIVKWAQACADMVCDHLRLS